MGRGKAKDLGSWKTRQNSKHPLVGMNQRFGNQEDKAEMERGQIKRVR